MSRPARASTCTTSSCVRCRSRARPRRGSRCSAATSAGEDRARNSRSSGRTSQRPNFTAHVRVSGRRRARRRQATPRIVEAMGGVNYFRFPLEIPEPRLWEPETPWLYQLQVRLLDAGARCSTRPGGSSACARSAWTTASDAEGPRCLSTAARSAARRQHHGLRAAGRDAEGLAPARATTSCSRRSAT